MTPDWLLKIISAANIIPIDKVDYEDEKASSQ